VEREHLGGICLNWGCIPTKALLRSFRGVSPDAPGQGIRAEGATGISYDLDAVVARSRGVAKQLSGGIGHLMKKNKVTVVMGQATVPARAGQRQDRQGGRGSDRPRDHPGHGRAGARIAGAGGGWRSGLDLQACAGAQADAQELLVIGSGAIGIEFASFFNTLGADDRGRGDGPHPAGGRCRDQRLCQEAVRQAGHEDLEKATVKKLDREPGVTAHIEQGGKVDAGIRHGDFRRGDRRQCRRAGAGGAGRQDRPHPCGDGRILPHRCPGLYAIGDIAGAPWLAHKASHEGRDGGRTDRGGHPHPIKPNSIAGCTYCHPQVASVGLTEEKAKAAGFEVKVGRFPFIGNGKAIALGEPEGMVKTVFDAKTGELLGAHMVGAEVTELIQGYVVGRTLETTEADLMNTVFPHPTLSEMMHEAVLDAYGRAIHF
jgi:dihydrolipoamide dehydrogenase